jgi:hypothetical protein
MFQLSDFSPVFSNANTAAGFLANFSRMHLDYLRLNGLASRSAQRYPGLLKSDRGSIELSNGRQYC